MMALMERHCTVYGVLATWNGVTNANGQVDGQNGVKGQPDANSEEVVNKRC
jgi:hypothetical protein